MGRITNGLLSPRGETPEEKLAWRYADKICPPKDKCPTAITYADINAMISKAFLDGLNCPEYVKIKNDIDL